MTARRPLLLWRSERTGQVYVLTSYDYDRNGNVRPKTKHDVTAMYRAIRRAEAQS